MNTKFAAYAYRYFLVWGILSSLATCICTIADALLVGNLIGSEGLAVTNLSTPVYLIYALFGITIGIGGSVSTGRLLGEGKVEEANDIFHVQLGIGLLVGAVMLTPLLFKEAYFDFLGVTPELYALTESYLTITMWSAPIFILYHILLISVRTDSDPKRAALASGVVIVTNLVLDIVFMGVLNWGIFGASASLCIGETLGMMVLLTHFIKEDRLLTLKVKLTDIRRVKEFTYNGFGIGSASIFGAVVMLVFNNMLLSYGEKNATIFVAIYGIFYTISTIPIAVFDGAGGALSTVSAFFVGESDTDSILEGLKNAVISVIVGGFFLAVLTAVFADKLVMFFGVSGPFTVKISAFSLRLFAVSIVFTGVNMVVTAFWQSVGRGKLAGLMSVLRNCILMIVIGIFFIPRYQITGVALTYICTEILGTVMILLILSFRSTKKYIEGKYTFEGRIFEQNYVIKTESMEQISADIEGICENWEIGMKESFLINFICEEMLLNIIKFGLDEISQKKKEGYYISIKLMEKENEYILRIRDNVSSYNPFESEGDEIDSGVLNLIQKKSKFCDYQRKMIFNYLYMVI